MVYLDPLGIGGKSEETFARLAEVFCLSVCLSLCLSVSLSVCASIDGWGRYSH